MPEHNRNKDILIGAMTIAMIVIIAFAVSQISYKASPTGADEGAPMLDKDGFTEFVAANIEGVVTEIDKTNSFLRIYDKQRGLIYTVFVSPTTTFIEKERTVSFTDIRLGDAIRATSNISQNAFEFHADSVTIVSHQTDQFPILPSLQKIPL